MSETYSLNSFTFESRESYEQAKKETEIIEQLKENTDLSNARTALKVYNKSISEKVFHTVAGYYFLLELRGIYSGERPGDGACACTDSHPGAPEDEK